MYKSLTSVQRDIFLSLLLLANHKAKTWEWRGKTFTCEPGQFITSLESIKGMCAKKVTTRNTRTALDKFAKWGFLTNESTKTGRLITILNWGAYQGNGVETDKETDKQVTKHRQTGDKQVTTNKNDKNVKNDKNKIILPDWLDKKWWNNFKEFRKEIKAKLTHRGEELAIMKLKKLKSSGNNPTEVIKQSIECGYKGLFELKQEGKNGKTGRRNQSKWEREQDAEADKINRELAEARAKQIAAGGSSQNDTH